MINKFLVDGTAYSRQTPLIIAELGTSHNGDLVKAKEMAAAAAESGALCVKLQMVFADEILHPNTGEVNLPGGKIRLYDMFRQLETPPEFYADVKEYVESLGLLFLCTPFGLKSAKILKELKPKIVKIASPELNYTALLREIAGWGLPVLLSTGVSRLGDIEDALAIIGNSEQGTGNRKQGAVPNQCSLLSAHCSLLCLLHCVTSYPAPETDYNLRVLQSLASVFGVSVGVSDHSLDPCLVPSLAVCQGAAVIEKHFCLSRTDPGLDDPIALPPRDFALMSEAIRRAAETGAEKTLAYISRERGASLVEAVLGSGVKTLAPSEQDNYERTNRSIHAIRDIHPGEIIKAEDFAVLRTEKILRPGLAPSWAERICGKTARQFIPAGEGIRFEDL
ncbi:MAG: N-acetylneuraminate synthase family protein [Treponema sp.]|jgi:sialic acid synthase SpsE|nr:N-acetylneuraminate synthase family protein [Treponema sp.]